MEEAIAYLIVFALIGLMVWALVREHDKKRKRSIEEYERDVAERGVDFIEYDGWQEIDALEQERGAAAGRPRIKLTAFEELLAAARKDRNG